MNEQLGAIHLQRRAAIYLRQSTLKQVYEHRESTARQYALRQRALDLGWAAGQIDTIDDDLGQSGRTTEKRAGFQRLAEAIANGRVGAVFALEVSRLSRSSADWHRLLDLCGVADAIIVDEQAVYSPRDFNDRLLLGLKGTMSEAEQYWMRLRLQGAKLSKAQRGELFHHPPAGYEWDPASRRLRLHPDEQVQRAVRLVFERFRFDGSANAVTRYFARHELKLPLRNVYAQDVQWSPPRSSVINHMLHNPAYAGVYAFGCSEERSVIVDGQVRRRRVVHLPEEAWKACLKDHHPAYIGWDEYMDNQKRLDANRTNHQRAQRGASREGAALLQGLVLCGCCGQRMMVRYHGRLARPSYACAHDTIRIGRRQSIWSVAGSVIDEAVAQLFLNTVQPPEIDLTFAVVRETERQIAELDRQWALQLERAQHEARHAERRYKAVDPDNRVVARTLEREWNEKLLTLADLQRQHEAARRREMLVLSAEDRARITALAKDLPALWNAPTTTHAERKNLLRMLVTEVALTPVDVPSRMTRVQVLWRTGAVTELMVRRRGREDPWIVHPDALDLIRVLCAQGKSDPQIAADLNRRGVPSGRARVWSKDVVARVRGLVLELPANLRTVPLRRADGLYSTRGVAEFFGVPITTVTYWVRSGLIEATDGAGPFSPRWYNLDAAAVERLRSRSPRRTTASATGDASMGAL